MEYLKAKTPVQAIDGCFKQIEHKMVCIESAQIDPKTGVLNREFSTLKLRIIQDWSDVIFMIIEVDGKHHILTRELVEVLKTLQDLTQGEPIQNK